MTSPVDMVPSRAMEILDDILAKADGEKPWRRRARKSYIYFIRAGDMVKIGVSVDPSKRFEALQTGCPIKCELVHIEYGGIEREAHHHQRFAELREHGEWFRYEDALRTFLDAYK